MTRVALLTIHGRYRGTLQLVSSAGQTVRLLDLLNFPQRMQAAGPGGRSTSGLILQNVTRTDLRRTEELPCGDSLTLRAEAVVMAWEEEAHTQSSAASTAAVGYEKRVLAEKERVVVHQVNGLRLEGALVGGTSALEPGRLAGKSFVPLTEVILIDPVTAAPPAFIPFAAINVHHLESYGPI